MIPLIPPNSIPDRKLVFRAFTECPLHTTNVVLLAQDPYSRAEKACGLSFAIPEEGISSRPDSLSVICKAANCLPGDPFTWPAQGVLMANAALTVEIGKPGSHQKLWREFTLNWIRELHKKEGVVWLLFGRTAQQLVMPKRFIPPSIVRTDSHSYIYVPHPSPANGAKFESYAPFDRCNEELAYWGKTPIKWSSSIS